MWLKIGAESVFEIGLFNATKNPQIIEEVPLYVPKVSVVQSLCGYLDDRDITTTVNISVISLWLHIL